MTHARFSLQFSLNRVTPTPGQKRAVIFLSAAACLPALQTQREVPAWHQISTSHLAIVVCVTENERESASWMKAGKTHRTGSRTANSPLEGVVGWVFRVRRAQAGRPQPAKHFHDSLVAHNVCQHVGSTSAQTHTPTGFSFGPSAAAVGSSWGKHITIGVGGVVLTMPSWKTFPPLLFLLL